MRLAGTGDLDTQDQMGGSLRACLDFLIQGPPTPSSLAWGDLVQQALAQRTLVQGVLSPLSSVLSLLER